MVASLKHEHGGWHGYAVVRNGWYKLAVYGAAGGAQETRDYLASVHPEFEWTVVEVCQSVQGAAEHFFCYPVEVAAAAAVFRG
jgi:hypothetical protein